MNKKDHVQRVKEIVSRDRIIDYTVELCEQETISPPGNECLCTPILKKYFNEIGVDEIKEYEKEEGRTNIVARIKGNRPGPTVAIVGHTDVVPVRGQNWSTNPFAAKIDGDKIIARGAIDNKGPFVATIEAVRVFKELVGNEFPGEILIISAADEERGSSMGIRYLFEELGIKTDFALIPDGGEFSEMVYGEMGSIKVEVNSKGRAFHGSIPEKGVNAIVPTASLVKDLDLYKWQDLKGETDFDATVLNIGLIEGGTATNIVPDKAKVTLQWRYPKGVNSEEIIEILEDLVSSSEKEYEGIKLEYEIMNISLPHSSSRDGKLVEACIRGATDLGLKAPVPETIRGATVGKFIHLACGAEVIVNGPQDGGMALMHQPDEYVKISSLVEFAKYYSVVLYNLLVLEKE